MTDLTEDDIRNADPEQISEWVAERRGDTRVNLSHFTGWKWSAPG